MIQRGGGAILYRDPDGGVQQLAFRQNDTLVVPPNLVHQVRCCAAGAHRRPGNPSLPPAHVRTCMYMSAPALYPAVSGGLSRQLSGLLGLPCLPACSLETPGERISRPWWCSTPRQ